jgi:hypothetical protein
MFDSFQFRANSILVQMDEKITQFLEALASFHASTHHMIASEGGIEAFMKNYPSLNTWDLRCSMLESHKLEYPACVDYQTIIHGDAHLKNIMFK